MKRIRVWILTVVMVFLLMITASITSAQGRANPGVLPPSSRVKGLSYGEWTARWWQYVLSIPTPQNPLIGGTGNNCVFQQIGKVGLVAFNPTLDEPIMCEVPNGMMLYLDILSAECSTLEEDPFYGGNEEELRACALSFTFSDLQASIDGSALQDLDQYIHISPLFEFTLPEDNVLASDVLHGESVSNGTSLILAPLSPGEHTVYFHATIPELDFTVDYTIELTVLH